MVGLSEIKSLNQKVKNSDIKRILESNLFVFKENIKILTNFTLDKSLDEVISQDNLNNVILKEMNKGDFKEIEEVDEESSSLVNSLFITKVG